METGAPHDHMKIDKARAPHDHVYGPMIIPNYCWSVVDTPEFQRLRELTQLGTVELVYPGANHTRFEHSLGCCHLASVFLNRIKRNQPEITVTEDQRQAVILAALCHDLGCGPYGDAFLRFVGELDPSWDHRKMSCLILRHIIATHKLSFTDDVINAACAFICGDEFPGWPAWLAQVVRNRDTAIDIDKFDYLCRDMNRTINTSRFEYDRLIVNCRVTEGKLSWKKCEIPTLERFFFNYGDLNLRVYKHRTVSALMCMIADLFEIIQKDGKFDFRKALNDPKIFSRLDDRLLYRVERGFLGEAAAKFMQKLMRREIYKCIGETKLPTGDNRSQAEIISSIAQSGGIEDPSWLRLVFVNVGKDEHPMRPVPFWAPETEGVIKLSKNEISEAETSRYTETIVRLYVTDPSKLKVAKEAFVEWCNHLTFQ